MARSQLLKAGIVHSPKEHNRPLKVGIVSDFIDYYDHAFVSRMDADVLWDRRSRTEMSKREQFEILQQLGLKTPRHGTVPEVYSELVRSLAPSNGTMQEYLESVLVVVYLDEYVHRGEGKTLMSLGQALRQYPGCYCSQYISGEIYPHPGMTYSLSYRHLQIGKRFFCLQYTGYGSWMSNHAQEVAVEILFWGENPASRLATAPFPVYAIDLVPGGPWLYAVDFNTAPGLQGTNLPLEPGEIYELVRGWYEENES